MAGVEAADPRKAAARGLWVRDQRLEILLEPGSETSPVRSEPWRRIHRVAFGKAACAARRAASDRSVLVRALEIMAHHEIGNQ